MSKERSPREVCSRTMGTSELAARPICIEFSFCVRLGRSSRLGQVRAGERTGFVEEVDEERRLVFWWAAPGEDSTRVELSLEEDGDFTHVRVVESRPLAMLDLYGAEIVTAAPPFRQPEMLAR